MNGIAGKNAIVSAGSSGLGRAIAVVMASYGANVTTFSRNEEKLKGTVEEVRQKTGKEINAVMADLSSQDDLKKVVESAHSRYGKIDLLIVNYGDPKVAPFTELSEQDWDYSINMIFRSTLFLTRSALKDMMESKSGRIVYVTSMVVKSPLENFSISTSLRSAVVGLGKTLSLEYAGRGINVNSITQGYFLTQRLRNVAKLSGERRNISSEAALDSIKESIPMKRFGEAEELGKLVAFLCADESSYITGTNINIDGGVVKFPF